MLTKNNIDLLSDNNYYINTYVLIFTTIIYNIDSLPDNKNNK